MTSATQFWNRASERAPARVEGNTSTRGCERQENRVFFIVVGNRNIYFLKLVLLVVFIIIFLCLYIESLLLFLLTLAAYLTLVRSGCARVEAEVASWLEDEMSSKEHHCCRSQQQWRPCHRRESVEKAVLGARFSQPERSWHDPATGLCATCRTIRQGTVTKRGGQQNKGGAI